jgi:hypothetical protein
MSPLEVIKPSGLEQHQNPMLHEMADGAPASRTPAQLLAASLLFVFSAFLVFQFVLVMRLADDSAPLPVAQRADVPFWLFRIASGAVAAGALGLFLFVGRRWARWIAIGWSLDVLANILTEAVSRGIRTFNGPVATMAIIMTVGAVFALILLGRPSIRRRFEPEWNTPIHHAYRWTAVSISACVTHAVVAGWFGIAAGVWEPVVASGLMLLSIALLYGGKVVGLPVAVLSLAAYAWAGSVEIPDFSGRAGIEAPSFGWYFFIGRASSVAWVPALAITLMAIVLAARQLARRARSAEQV